MFKRIVVPLDGSRLAEGALNHAVAVALACQAELQLIRVVERRSGEGRGVTDLLDWQLRMAEARSYLEVLANQLQQHGVAAEIAALEGAPATRIIDYTHERDGDLIILSSHGRSGLERWNVSGVVQKVIQEAKTSLLLVRAYEEPEWKGAPTAYRRIMVPLDGSKRAECTLPLAEKLARYWNAELLFVHVLVPPRMFHHLPPSTEEVDYLEWFLERNREEALQYFEALQERLPIRSQVRVRVNDDVVEAFHDIVHRDAVDLLLLTAHGHSCSPHRRYGSLVTGCLLFGCGPSLVVQDRRPEAIEATGAERVIEAMETEGIRLPEGSQYPLL
ncbi:MAG: universal stress protein [Anaerolineae bacterium]|nr:universal stress protein [Anaerolineae bacterium]